MAPARGRMRDATVDLADVPAPLRHAVGAALEAAGVVDGHLAVEIVSEDRIRELNAAHRGIDRPTDVLAFPLDGTGPALGPRELGDVVICPGHCSDEVEAAVHGVLHLCGYDHEADDGETLELQARVLSSLGPLPSDRAERGSVHVCCSASEREQRRGAELTRSGFVGLAGRPNAGKSTLVNALVGARIVITSVRPQTTRRAVRGVVTDLDAGWQLVLVDLPGVQRPRDVMTERMQRRVERELVDSDIALIVVNGEEGVGAGDRFIARKLIAARPNYPIICAVNKCDRLSPAETVEVLAAAADLKGVDEIFPISARTGYGLEELMKRLVELMPEGDLMYPPEDRSDVPSDVLLAELIREQVLNRTREEIPHSVDVRVLEHEERDDGLILIRAEIWVEAESQKGILIGRGGRKVEEIGTAARRELEVELGGKVHLDLTVRVRRKWRRDEGMLDRLGIE